MCDDRRHLHDDEDAELAARRAEAIGQPVIVVGFQNADTVTVCDVNTAYDDEQAAHEKLVDAQPKPEDFFSPEELDALREPGGFWTTEPATGEQRATWRKAHPELLPRFHEWTQRPVPPPPPQRVKRVATVPRLRPVSASAPSLARPEPVVIARPQRSGRAPRGRRVRTAASSSRDGPSSSDDGDDEPAPDVVPAPRGRVRVLLGRLGRFLRGER